MDAAVVSPPTEVGATVLSSSDLEAVAGRNGLSMPAVLTLGYLKPAAAQSSAGLVALALSNVRIEPGRPNKVLLVKGGEGRSADAGRFADRRRKPEQGRARPLSAAGELRRRFHPDRRTRRSAIPGFRSFSGSRPSPRSWRRTAKASSSRARRRWSWIGARRLAARRACPYCPRTATGSLSSGLRLRQAGRPSDICMLEHSAIP